MPELIGFRVASWDTPLRVNPNRHPGRFNHANSGATQYIALHPLATWAEYMRWHDLREPGALSEIRLGVWAIKVIVDELLSVNYDNAATLDLDPGDLISDDWTACQVAAERLRSDRNAPKVLRTPSAALPGTSNIVILQPRVAIPYSARPLDPIDMPVTLCAAGARPPESLLDLVRFHGQEHIEHQAWQRGEPYQLSEPPDTLLAQNARPAT